MIFINKIINKLNKNKLMMMYKMINRWNKNKLFKLYLILMIIKIIYKKK